MNDNLNIERVKFYSQSRTATKNTVANNNNGKKHARTSQRVRLYSNRKILEHFIIRTFIYDDIYIRIFIKHNYKNILNIII